MPIIILLFLLAACSNEPLGLYNGQAYSKRVPPDTPSTFLNARTARFQPGMFSRDTLNLEFDIGENTPEEVIKTNRISADLNDGSLIRQSSQFSGDNETGAASQSFHTRQPGQLDMLIVMDSSASMVSYQDQLVEALASLLQPISHLDWQIGVVTTEERSEPRGDYWVKGPCLRRLPDSDGRRIIRRADYDRDPEATTLAFRKLLYIEPHDRGSPKERGIKSAAEGVVGDCGDPEKNWLRPEAHLSVFIVSDEPHCGSGLQGQGEWCPGAPWNSARYFLEKNPKPLAKTTVSGLFLMRDLMGEYGSYGQVPALCRGSVSNDAAPFEYIHLVEATSGHYGEICQGDYQRVLNQIGTNIADRSIKKFALDHEPIAGSINVRFNREEVDFSVEGSEVVIADPLPEGMVEILYDYLQAPIRDRFSVPAGIDLESLKVVVNDRELERWEYRLDLGNREIILGSALGRSDLLELSFYSADQRRYRWLLPKGLEARELLEPAVMVDGRLLDNESYRLSKNFLVIPDGLMPYHKIKLEGKYLETIVIAPEAVPDRALAEHVLERSPYSVDVKNDADCVLELQEELVEIDCDSGVRNLELSLRFFEGYQTQYQLPNGAQVQRILIDGVTCTSCLEAQDLGSDLLVEIASWPGLKPESEVMAYYHTAP